MLVDLKNKFDVFVPKLLTIVPMCDIMIMRTEDMKYEKEKYN